MAAKLSDRLRDPSLRHLRVGERLGGTQDDQVLKGKQPGVAGSARGRHEPGGDQRSNRTARQSKQLLDVTDAVRVHALAALTAGTYFLAALRTTGAAGAAASAGC